MRKQITSLLLTLAMLLSLVPTLGVTASAAEPEWTTVNTYKELLDAVKGQKEYIKLGQNIDTTSYNEGIGLLERDTLTFKYTGYHCTLDLNGKTLALRSSDANMFYGIDISLDAHLTIQDNSSAKTGKISGTFNNVLGGRDAILIYATDSTLTLEGGTFTVDSNPYKENATVIDSERSFVTIKDGVKISQPEFFDGGYASDLDGAGYALKAKTRKNGQGSVIIDGGEFDGCVNLTGSQAENGSVQINGGTFKKDVQVLYTAEENNSDPAVTVNGGTFESNVYLQYWPWKTSLYMPYRLNGGTFKGTVNLHAKTIIAHSSGSGYFVYGDIGTEDQPEGNPNIALGLDQCFGYSAVVTPNGTFTGPNVYTAVLKKIAKSEGYKMLLEGSASNPVRIIPDAWDMKSVTLDGKSIDYFKDWKGTVERMDNSTAHTLKFEWKPLAQELKDAGYTYRTKCEHYISGSTAVQKTETIDANKTSHTVTIPKGADPKVYSYDLQLNLDKNGSSIGIISNEHIVKLVVSEAPEVQTLTGKASYINSAVFGKPVLFSGTITPGVYIWECQFQWQRSTDGGSTWKDIPDATDGQYIPGAADMGENVRIRVVITKNGYLGEIVSTPAKVSKAANDNTPALPNVTAQKNADGTYTAFQISNFKSDQEYIYTTSAPTSGNGWPTGGTPITSATVNGLNQGSTYYIFTRYKGTDTHQTGSKVSSTSVLLDEITMLNRVILTDANGRKYNFYGSGNIIYIKKGESMTLTAKTNPVGATTWSGFTFKSQYGASAPFTVTAPTGPVASGSTIPSVTIRGDKAGTGTLSAEYGGYTPQSYGTWRVHVYENVSDIGTAADIIVAPSFPDLTMRPGETMPLPEYAVSVYPKGALDNYTLEWRIIKVGSGGAAYSMRDDHITLENGKIEPTKAHTGSEKTRLELVAVNKTKQTDIRSFSPSVGFYITVGDAPLVELTGLTLTPKKVDLEVGKSYQLSAVKEPANAEGSLTWTSSKPAVAAVDKSGKVTAKGEGTATITVTCGTKSAACTVTVSKPLVPEVPGTSFTDVPTGTYYEEAVGWAVEKGITKGTSDSTFTPDGVCTRAQAVTFLWRAAGSPAAKAGSLPFADVKAGSYYDDAVRWAVENGVTVGTSATTFSPNATCSRAQIVTFLWRAQKSPAAGSANPFDDVASSAYYADAVQWAVQKNITKGTGATAFSPDANCIRAQIVTFLYRSMK